MNVEAQLGMFALFFGATDSTTEGTPNAQAKERVRSYVSPRGTSSRNIFFKLLEGTLFLIFVFPL